MANTSVIIAIDHLSFSELERLLTPLKMMTGFDFEIEISKITIQNREYNKIFYNYDKEKTIDLP